MISKLRFFKIESPDFPPLYCRPVELSDSIHAIIGDDPGENASEGDPMEPITITVSDAWMTQAEYDTLGDWSP